MRASRVNKTCPQCGKAFSVPPSLARQIYCSKPCYGTKQTGVRKVINCETCGKPFEAKKDHGKWQRFCNRKCFRSQKTHPINKACRQCKKQFKAYWQTDRQKHHVYCSQACYKIAQIVLPEKSCPNCGKMFRPPSQRTKGKDEVFCSRECYWELKSGDKSPSYKGGSYVSNVGVRFVALGPHTSKVGYKGEHRLIVEKAIGRKLKHWSEPVLHLNGDKLDNRLENLYVCKNNSHMGKIMQGKEPFPQKSNVHEL